MSIKVDIGKNIHHFEWKTWATFKVYSTKMKEITKNTNKFNLFSKLDLEQALVKKATASNEK